MKNLAEFFAALSDPTRLAMVALLRRHGELCVCEIQDILGVTQSRASRHLRTLRQAGLLDGRRIGAWVHYRVANRPGESQKTLLETLDRLLPPKALNDLDKRLAAYRKKCCLKPGGKGPRRSRPIARPGD